MKLNFSHLLICLIPLCFGCTDSASHTTEIIEGTDCEADTMRCISNSDGSQSLMTCTNGLWKETPCTTDKPVCDEQKYECVAQPQNTDSCDPQKCEAPENATAKCIYNKCAFECIENYHQEGDTCVINQEDSPYCGDGQCNNNETCESCEADCGQCGIIPVCGDTYCDSKETCESCPEDCGHCGIAPTCGDGNCDSTESCESCEADCGQCGIAPTCGDGNCDSTESCESCEADCGQCEIAPTCGDGTCDSTETCESCEADCGKCEPTVKCGDGTCDNTETCKSCEADCGKCEPTIKCGDGKCDSTETCKSCEADCGKCEPTVKCGDGKCDSTETYASCKEDCASKHPCANSCPNKIAFLYSGKYCSNDSCTTKADYGTYSTQDIDNFGLTHFVINPNGSYNVYGSGNSSNQYPEIIQAMKETLTTIINSTNGKNKRVWISTPPFVHYTAIMNASTLSSKQAIYTKHTPIFKKYIQDLREALGPDIWNTYVIGIYMNSEQVFSKDIFQTIDYNSPYSHAHVKMFKDIADEVHKSVTSGGKTWNAKEFL